MDIKALSFTGCVILFGGCATVSQDEAFGTVEKLSYERGSMPLQWSHSADEARETREKVDQILTSPLSLDNAVRIGLINSPRLQQAYSDVGIAQSELVQAGLWSNPVLGYSLGKGNGITQTTFSLEFAFLDLLWIPIRKELAGMALEETQYRIGNEVLLFVRDLKQLYVDAVSKQQQSTQFDTILKSSEASVQLAARQYGAGNLSKRDYLRIHEMYLQNHMESIRLAEASASAREALTRMLGLFGTQTRYTLPPFKESLTEYLPLPETVEKTAIERRLDVSAARKRLQYDATEAGYTIDMRLLTEGTLEFDREKNSGEAGALKTLGAKIALPVFDYGQGRVSGAQTKMLQSLHRLYESAINARSEVREAYAKTKYRLDIAKEQQDYMVPVRRQILEETQKQYNGMLEGIDELLADQRVFAQQEIDLIDQIAEYKKAYYELEYAMGGANGGR